MVMAVRNKTKPSRNAPCPCGSGLKFKRCCRENGRYGEIEASTTEQTTTWKQVCCQVPLRDERFLILTLAYSNDWIQRTGIQTGKFIALDLPEISFHSHAFVMAIQEFPQSASREGELLVAIERQEGSEFGMVIYGEGPLAQEIMDHRRRLSREVVLVLEKPDGAWVDITLLRSVKWLESNNAQVGKNIFLDLPHMGARGFARVLEINPCPELPTPGICLDRSQFVTGTFCHSSGDVYDLKLKSEKQPLGVTATHPFWSADRQDWVCVIDLHIGETLETLKGITVVESLTKRSKPEMVYNIEVEGDHVYRVGESGVLVHNASPGKCPSSGDYDPGALASAIFQGQNVSRATGVTAIVVEAGADRSGNEFDSTNTPGWYNTFITVNRISSGPAGGWRRGHILGAQFGGPAEAMNFAPQPLEVNNGSYKTCENRIAEVVKACGCAYVSVSVNYDDRGVRPASFTITAEDSSGHKFINNAKVENIKNTTTPVDCKK